VQCLPDDVDPTLSLERCAWSLPFEPSGKEQAVCQLPEVGHGLFPNRQDAGEVSGVWWNVDGASGQRDAVTAAPKGGSRCPIAICFKELSRRDGAIHLLRKHALV
jgi:hypothetical protein